MSKLIRKSTPGPAVVIGERYQDTEREVLAEQPLRRFFPSVEIEIDPDGSRQIPVLAALRIVQEHQQRLNATRQSAFDEGYQAGVTQGRAEGAAQTEQVLKQFDGAIKDAVSQREQLLEQARQKLFDLVMQISRKVTFDAVKVDPDCTLAIINRVIDSLVDRSRLKINVNPEHYPHIKENINRFADDTSLVKDLTIEADPRVRVGGGLIETPA